MANIKRNGNFTTVTNDFIRSTDISFKAKGVFVYMASFSDDWNFTIKSMATQSKDGYDSIKTSIQELKELGYIRYEKHEDGTGTYFLTEDPKVENPRVENPFKGKATPIKKNKPIKKNNTYTKKDIYKDFIKQLQKECIDKAKVTSTEEGFKLFEDIEDKGKLFANYIAHQQEQFQKGEINMAVRITKFMLNYNTIYKPKYENKNKEVQPSW